jgi:UDP:flavonoid glycosyltransferase YjiC (YdhE family)
MRILFTCRPTTGHFLPLVPLARIALRLGHEVAFASAEPIVSQARKSGFQIFPAGQDDGVSLRALIASGVAYFELPPAQMRMVAFGTLFGKLEAPPRLPDLLRNCTDFRPDVIVHEAAELAAPVVGARLGLPWVTVGFGPLLKPEIANIAADGAAPMWREHGLEPQRWAGLYQHLYVDPCPPAMQLPAIAALPACIGIRPASMAPPESVRTRMQIYVTFGTLWDTGPAAIERLRIAVAGAAAVGVPVIVTVGHATEPEVLGPQPAHVQVHRFIAQDQILPHCACVLGHGGAGTLLGSLGWGVPLLLVPQFADQFDNADRAVAAGVALALQRDEVSVGAITAALNRLLHEPAFAARAASVQRELAAMPDPPEVFARIEALTHVSARPLSSAGSRAIAASRFPANSRRCVSLDFCAEPATGQDGARSPNQ